VETLMEVRGGSVKLLEGRSSKSMTLTTPGMESSFSRRAFHRGLIEEGQLQHHFAVVPFVDNVAMFGNFEQFNGTIGRFAVYESKTITHGFGQINNTLPQILGNPRLIVQGQGNSRGRNRRRLSYVDDTGCHDILLYCIKNICQ
jgi:hypothetical protein